MIVWKKIIVVLLFVLITSSAFADGKSAKDTILEFYKQYLDHRYYAAPKKPRPILLFSKSFAAEIKKNKNICKKYSDGVCGWAADSDEYLNVQDQDENLNYNNSGIQAVEIAPNTIRVTLNVFPFEKNNKVYERVITYKMLQENGRLVVDDIIYDDNSSSRKLMEEENKFNILNPSRRSKTRKF
jgi:hypothetical protein